RGDLPGHRPEIAKVIELIKLLGRYSFRASANLRYEVRKCRALFRHDCLPLAEKLIAFDHLAAEDFIAHIIENGVGERKQQQIFLHTLLNQQHTVHEWILVRVWLNKEPVHERLQNIRLRTLLEWGNIDHGQFKLFRALMQPPVSFLISISLNH